jgi:hypothetical protein
MWTDHLRGRGLQPELPLDDGPPLPGGPAHDWRLDERTRRVGRAGVAAARAELRAPTPACRTGASVPTADDRRPSEAGSVPREERAA